MEPRHHVAGYGAFESRPLHIHCHISNPVSGSRSDDGHQSHGIAGEHGAAPADAYEPGDPEEPKKHDGVALSHPGNDVAGKSKTADGAECSSEQESGNL